MNVYHKSVVPLLNELLFPNSQPGMAELLAVATSYLGD